MRYELSEHPLDLDSLIASVTCDDAGAVVTFVGNVRATSDDGRAVTGLSYEAHHEIALAELRLVGDEASTRFGPARVAIVHRLGALALGEAAVAIAVAAPHRAAAFDACEYAIDQLKRRVPIWKKEHFRDGAAEWRENVVPER